MSIGETKAVKTAGASVGAKTPVRSPHVGRLLCRSKSPTARPKPIKKTPGKQPMAAENDLEGAAKPKQNKFTRTPTRTPLGDRYGSALFLSMS